MMPGKCHRCGKAPRPERRHCFDCAVIVAERQRAYYRAVKDGLRTPKPPYVYTPPARPRVEIESAVFSVDGVRYSIRWLSGGIA